MTSNLKTAIHDMRLSMEFVDEIVRSEFPVGSRWRYTDPTRASRTGIVMVNSHGGTYTPDHLRCEWVELPEDELKWLGLTGNRMIVCEVEKMKRV
jgi:hypothetical protein